MLDDFVAQRGSVANCATVSVVSLTCYGAQVSEHVLDVVFLVISESGIRLVFAIVSPEFVQHHGKLNSLHILVEIKAQRAPKYAETGDQISESQFNSNAHR